MLLCDVSSCYIFLLCTRVMVSMAHNLQDQSPQHAMTLLAHHSDMRACPTAPPQVVAVFKDDGERGHHMQDYIPKEELAKFMARTGDTKLAQEVRGLVVWLCHTSAAACTVQCCPMCTAPP
jgi:hypothetical protein